MCGGGTRDHPGFDFEGWLGRRSSRRRYSAAPWISAPCASIPATWSAEEASSWPGKVQCVLMEVEVSSEGDGEAQDGELAVDHGSGSQQ
jgi:hypothetical protein